MPARIDGRAFEALTQVIHETMIRFGALGGMEIVSTPGGMHTVIAYKADDRVTTALIDTHKGEAYIGLYD